MTTSQHFFSHRFTNLDHLSLKPTEEYMLVLLLIALIPFEGNLVFYVISLIVVSMSVFVLLLLRIRCWVILIFDSHKCTYMSWFWLSSTALHLFHISAYGTAYDIYDCGDGCRCLETFWMYFGRTILDMKHVRFCLIMYIFLLLGVLNICLFGCWLCLYLSIVNSYSLRHRIHSCFWW